MGKTLWEMMWAEDKPKYDISNPWKVELGASVIIDDIDYLDKTFNVVSIHEYTREIYGEKFIFTDYTLVESVCGGTELRLRMMPMSVPGEAVTHTFILLKNYCQMAYDESIYNVVTAATKQFEVFENGVLTETYSRINDVQNSYQPTVVSVSENDLSKRKLEYWDYWRETPNEAGINFVQYLFVEMDSESGWFQMWQGVEVDPQRLTVI